MRESPAASIAQRIVKAVTRAVDAIARGTEAALAGTQPQPQLVPVRVSARTR